MYACVWNRAAVFILIFSMCVYAQGEGRGVVVGLQVRLGMEMDQRVYADRPPAGSAPEYVR